MPAYFASFALWDLGDPLSMDSIRLWLSRSFHRTLSGTANFW